MAGKLLHPPPPPLIRAKQIALAAAMVAATGSAMADVSVYGIVDANVNNSKAEAGSKPLGQLGATLGVTPAATGDTAAVTAAKTAATATLKAITDTLPTAADQAGQGRVGSSGLSTSRIGFKGTEDLGGGMSASFQLEGKLNVDTGENANYDGGFFGRQSWVGLSGNFGTLQLGKTWTSFDDVKGSFEHADNTNVSVTSSVWDAFGNNYDNNVANQIKCTLPAMGGLTASLGYSFGENKTSGSGTGTAADPRAQGQQRGQPGHQVHGRAFGRGLCLPNRGHQHLGRQQGQPVRQTAI
jgi:predicted porin